MGADQSREPGPDDLPREAGEDEAAAVVVPIEEALDLHPFSPRDVLSVVESYLEEAAHRGFAEVRLIHGRGKGVQRALVQRLLADHPMVVAFADAPPERGGWGATLVHLRRPEGPASTADAGGPDHRAASAARGEPST
jgi:dsDNA-specific endonuclease/ATPase MutS2